ncbi:hypothetical protein RB195_006366 [Necator americanus]|uniref:Uncharacterized protein n=1 Tax=Necator americanus TaxID=51031 RepID=A0ABR1BSB0_NECAM
MKTTCLVKPGKQPTGIEEKCEDFTLQLHRVSSVAHYPGGRQIKFIHVRNVCRNTSGQPALYTIGKLVWKRNMKSLLKKEWPRRGLDIFQFGFQMCPQG